MNKLISMGQKAKESSYELGAASINVKNDALFFMAEELVNAKDEIIEANKIDLINSEEKGTPKGEVFEVLAGLFKKETEKREEQIEKTSQKLQYAFDFLELVFGEGQELVLFVTELNTNPYSVSFISENGCDSYYKYNKKLLFEEEQGEILKELNQIEEEM